MTKKKEVKHLDAAPALTEAIEAKRRELHHYQLHGLNDKEIKAQDELAALLKAVR